MLLAEVSTLLEDEEAPKFLIFSLFPFHTESYELLNIDLRVSAKISFVVANA